MRRSVVVLVVLAACGSGTANAQTTLPGTYAGPTRLAAGPVLVGDRVAWAGQPPPVQLNPDDERSTTYLYSAPVTGGAARRLAEVAEITSDSQYSEGTALLSLSGSPGHLAWMTTVVDDFASKFDNDTPTPYRLWAMDEGGKAAKLCDGDRAAPMTNPTVGLSLAGNALGVSGCKGAPGVSVRDLSRPGTPPATLAADGGPVRLAGNYAAWRTATGFQVLDRTSGALTALSIEHSPLPAPMGSFDLSAEGVLAVSGGVAATLTSPTRDPYVAWASPADPSWHVIAVPGLPRGGIRVRAGRIAVATQPVVPGPVQLRLVDLAGRQEVVAQGDDLGSGSPGFDFDGSSVAWAGQVCDALVVAVGRVDPGTVTLPARSACPVVVDTSAVRVPKRVAHVGLRCPAPTAPRPTDTCRGTIRLTVAGAGPIGDGSFRVSAGTNRLARVTLTARAARSLGRKRRLTARVAVRSVTRGQASRSSARVVLRAR